MFETSPCPCFDRSYVVLNLANTKDECIALSKSYRKFKNDLLDDENFVNAFKFF